ncbi:hypothetical protein [Archangium violaceum]|uniref:Uncharacterized protein n=1 Tax=Archangium violaceum Cb vi76 TaxID=1406225 RepID=A0A084SMK2_9BACT|nr:hypothetical protein [Archangium violaceum]KFA89687.1 hypothetical protein Q664_32865 [Archangium violaceum Cb vi76]
MTSTLLVVLLPSQADGPTPPPVGAVEPPRPASLPASTLLFARGQDMPSPGAFASGGLGVDHAR